MVQERPHAGQENFVKGSKVASTSCHSGTNIARQICSGGSRKYTSATAKLASSGKIPDYTHCRAESDMAECLQGLRIALLAADGVGQVELDASGEAVRQAGAQTQLLSLRSGHIESLDTDLGPARTYTVDQTVAQATVNEYEALLLVHGTVKSDRLSSDDRVVCLVRDFITSGKPVGIVCYGAWTLLEAGVARGQSLPLSGTMRTHRKTGASVCMGALAWARA